MHTHRRARALAAQRPLRIDEDLPALHAPLVAHVLPGRHLERLLQHFRRRAVPDRHHRVLRVRHERDGVALEDVPRVRAAGHLVRLDLVDVLRQRLVHVVGAAELVRIRNVAHLSNSGGLSESLTLCTDPHMN